MLAAGLAAPRGWLGHICWWLVAGGRQRGQKGGPGAEGDHGPVAGGPLCPRGPGGGNTRGRGMQEQRGRGQRLLLRCGHSKGMLKALRARTQKHACTHARAHAASTRMGPRTRASPAPLPFCHATHTCGLRPAWRRSKTPASAAGALLLA